MKQKRYLESMNLGQYHGKGYMGLANLGNTCFLNSCLQVLNHVYELNEIFFVKKYHTRIAPGTTAYKTKKMEIQFVNEWTELQQLLWKDQENRGGAVSPNKFISYVQYLARIKGCELFTGWAQNDMPEFLLFMIDTMHNSICRPVKMQITGTQKTNMDEMAIESYKVLQTVYEKEYSEILDMFYGIYVSTIHSVSSNQEIHSKKPELFFILDLPLPKRINTDPIISLYDCFDLFVEPELLEGENAWLNEKTGQKEQVTKKIQFWNFPDILVVVLKRFSGHGLNKRQDLVDFPLNGLDLSKYICGYNSGSYVYDLFGICNHMGSIMGGHYHCYVKNSKENWVHYNDTQCQHVNDPRSMITPYAYCLFYRKK